MAKPRSYRDFVITEINEGPGANWQVTHEDFDGAPDANDNRSSHFDTAGECIDYVDDWHADQDFDAGLCAVLDEAFGKVGGRNEHPEDAQARRHVEGVGQ